MKRERNWSGIHVTFVCDIHVEPRVIIKWSIGVWYSSSCARFHKITLIATSGYVFMPLQWRNNDHDGVSNHQPHGCLLSRLFRRRSKKTSKLRVTGLCAGNSPGPVNSPYKKPVTRKMFPFDDVIMPWRRHGMEKLSVLLAFCEVNISVTGGCTSFTKGQ